MRFAVAGILAVASLFLAGCGSGGGGGTTAAGGGEAISLSEAEFKIDPSTVNVDQSGTVTLRITNNGKVDHALEIEGPGLEEQKTDTIGPGESADLTVELSKTGEYEFYCPIDGHRQNGMEGMLIVGGAGASGGTGGATTGEQEGTTGGGYGYGSG